MWYVCDVPYAVLYVRVSCFAVRGCAVSRRYINVCNCDMFSVVNVYFDHLKFCVVQPMLLLFAFQDLWKEWGDSNFQIFSQNCQSHRRRLESLEHLNVLFISFLALQSHFLDLKDAILFLQGLLF